jgi:hypothetical protein
LLIQESALPYKGPSSAQLEMLAPLFAQGRKENALRTSALRAQPYFLVALVHAAIRQAIELGEQVSLRDVSDEVVHQFLHGASAARSR